MPQSLIQWDRLPLEEATWVNDSDLQSLLPNLHLEDKVPVEEEGIVTNESADCQQANLSSDFSDKIEEQHKQNKHTESVEEIAEKDAELEDLMTLNESRKSRRQVREPYMAKRLL